MVRRSAWSNLLVRSSLHCGSMKTRTPISLGTLQSAANFATGRASSGVKVSYPLAWSYTTIVVLYLGLYGCTDHLSRNFFFTKISPPCRSCKDGPGA